MLLFIYRVFQIALGSISFGTLLNCMAPKHEFNKCELPPPNAYGV